MFSSVPFLVQTRKHIPFFSPSPESCTLPCSDHFSSDSGHRHQPKVQKRGSCYHNNITLQSSVLHGMFLLLKPSPSLVPALSGQGRPRRRTSSPYSPPFSLRPRDHPPYPLTPLRPSWRVWCWGALFRPPRWTVSAPSTSYIFVTSDLSLEQGDSKISPKKSPRRSGIVCDNQVELG